MAKKDLKNMFKDKMDAIEVKETLVKENVFSIDTSEIDFGFCDLADRNINDKLKNLSIQYFSIRAKSTISMGQIFNEAFEILTEEGNYEKWLLGIGVDKKTALRYRKRATLYIMAKEEDKPRIATLPQKYIDKIFENKSLLEDLTNIEESINETVEEHTKEEVKEAELLEEDLEKEIEDTFHNVINVIDSLEKNKQKEVHILMKKIQKIIQS